MKESLKVDVYKRKKKTNDTTSLMYRRVFDPHITKEIRMYGLNDNDFFKVDSNVSSTIKLRFIGGRGNDSFNINGNVRNYIYDLNSSDTSREKNFVIHSSHSKD